MGRNTGNVWKLSLWEPEQFDKIYCLSNWSILVPLQFITFSLELFYQCELLLSGFLSFKGNFYMAKMIQNIALHIRPWHQQIFLPQFQSNVFDATRLFQANHMVHWNVPREGIFLVWISDVHSQHDFSRVKLTGVFVSHKTVSMAAVYQQKIKHDQDKFGVAF